MSHTDISGNDPESCPDPTMFILSDIAVSTAFSVLALTACECFSRGIGFQISPMLGLSPDSGATTSASVVSLRGVSKE